MTVSPHTKRILIVGACTGDSCIASALVAAGHQVIIADPWLPAKDFDEQCVAGYNVSDRATIDDVFKSALEQLGGIDTLVFAAANDAVFRFESSMEQRYMSNTTWRLIMTELLYGGFYWVQAALRHMLPISTGSIVFLCADRAVDGHVREPALAAASCGLLAMSSSLAGSAFRHGISMNALIVGAPFAQLEVPSGLSEETDRTELAYGPKASYSTMRNQVINRLGNQTGIAWAESVSALIGHLQSDAGRLISGSTLRLANIGKHSPLIRWSY